MKLRKVFNFGKIDYTGNGRKNNDITIEVEYRETQNGMEFSACGNIYNRFHSDIIMGGQCLDDLKEYIGDNETFKIIYRLWNLYHLNSMRSTCEHQRELGWDKLARKEAYIYHWKLNDKMVAERKKIKKSVMNRLLSGETVCLTEYERKIMNLEYFYDSYTETLDNELAEFYNSYDSFRGHKEFYRLGTLKETEHPDGILNKPCPVCGHKYGERMYMPIPEEDDKIIRELLS